MNEINEVVKSEVNVIDLNDNRNLEGIGGWLILVLIGLIISIITSAYAAWEYDIKSLIEKSLYVCLDPQSELYNLFVIPTLIYELFINIGSVLVSIVLLILLFKKKKKFPKVFCIFNIVYIFLFIIDNVLAIKMQKAYNQDVSYSGVLSSDVIRQLIPTIIWVNYMIRSERVKNTFVN